MLPGSGLYGTYGKDYPYNLYPYGSSSLLRDLYHPLYNHRNLDEINNLQRTLQNELKNVRTNVQLQDNVFKNQFQQLLSLTL